jgi:hypothetical protein
MKFQVHVAALALATFIPLVAQAPKGWKVRFDRSTEASDPDASGAIKFVTVGHWFLGWAARFSCWNRFAEGPLYERRHSRNRSLVARVSRPSKTRWRLLTAAAVACCLFYSRSWW